MSSAILPSTLTIYSTSPVIIMSRPALFPHILSLSWSALTDQRDGLQYRPMSEASKASCCGDPAATIIMYGLYPRISAGELLRAAETSPK